VARRDTMSKGSWQDVPGEGETVIDDEDIIEIEDDELAKRANPETDLDGFKTPVPTGDEDDE
jgi:hypothetical protein